MPTQNYDLEALGPDVRNEWRQRMVIEHGELTAANYLLENLLNRQLMTVEHLRRENIELLKSIGELKETIEAQRLALGGRPRKNRAARAAQADPTVPANGAQAPSEG